MQSTYLKNSFKIHKNAELFIIYDVACTLKKYVKVVLHDILF